MNSPRSAWIVYTVLRLVFFAVPFALVYLLGQALGFSQMLSAIIGAVIAGLIGVSLSVIFLSKQRETASESIYEWRQQERTPDSIAEDEAIDAADQPDDSDAVAEDAAPIGRRPGADPA
ncbi:DUF4229 domain-containing protein [Leucobacter zeae]|nr:DUF4229 domain-containing protein [Leucobacter zeae]